MTFRIETLYDYVPLGFSQLFSRESDLIRDIIFYEKDCKLFPVETMKKCLYDLQLHVPFLFETHFMALNKESLTPFWISLSHSSVNFYYAAFIPFSILCYQQIQSIQLESSSYNLDTKQLNDDDGLSIRSEKKKKKWLKDSKKSKKNHLGEWDASAFEDILAFTEKAKKSTVFMMLKNERLNELSLTLLSLQSSAKRLSELFEYFSSLNNSAHQSVENLIDDPNEFGKLQLTKESVTCIATVDYIAESQEELSFCDGNIIKITEKLGKDLYKGELDGRVGTIKKQYLRFKELSTADKIKKMSKGVNLQLVPVYLADGMKMMMAIPPRLKAKELRDQIIEKIELQDHEFFDICDCSVIEDRWLDADIPVLSQINSKFSRLEFKARFYFNDISDVTDPKAIHLYFAQIKKQVVNGSINVNESEMVILGSYNLQAVLGDHDPDKHKPGYLE